MRVGRGGGDMVNTGRDQVRLASLRMEEIMGGLTIWWCWRRLAPGQWQRQERHSQVVGTRRLQGIIVGLRHLAKINCPFTFSAE